MKRWRMAIVFLSALVSASLVGVVQQSQIRADEDAINLAESVEINETNFPDANFRAYVASNLDPNQDGMLSSSERYQTRTIECGGLSISSLKGIEVFGHLYKLDCHNNMLAELDISVLHDLDDLNCSNNKLTVLNLNNRRECITLNCSNNKLSELDLCNHIFWDLDCSNNQLTVLEADRIIVWENLNCSNNMLTSIVVSFDAESQCEKTVNCSNNQLTRIDITDSLKRLDCSNNLLTELIIPGCEMLIVNNNKLTSLAVSHSGLDTLDCSQNALSELDLHDCKNLRILCCSQNKLTALDISENTGLRKLFCQENLLTELDVRNTQLRRLNCQGNQIHSLNIDTCSDKMWNYIAMNGMALSEDETYNYCKDNDGQIVLAYDVSVQFTGKYSPNNLPPLPSPIPLPLPVAIENDEDHFPDPVFRKYLSMAVDTDADGILSEDEIEVITSINLAGEFGDRGKYGIREGITSLKGIEYFTSLEYLYCGNGDREEWAEPNVITDLDLRGCTNLARLDCSSNKITELDLSGCTNLVNLDCSVNRITKLDLSGCTNLVNLDCSVNGITKLDFNDCTNLAYLDCSFNKITELNHSSCTNLVNLDCSGNRLTSIDPSKFMSLNTLNCGDNELKTLHMSQNSALTALDCHNTRLTDLDVSNNAALKELDCSGNRLTSLDVSNNPSLKVLKCGSNQLSELDVSKNAALKELDCSGNRLTSLDVSNNPSLTILICSYNCFDLLDLSDCKKLLGIIDWLEGGAFTEDGKRFIVSDADTIEGESWIVIYFEVDSYVETTPRLFNPKPNPNPTPTPTDAPVPTGKPTKTPTKAPTQNPTPTPTKAPVKDPTFEDFVERLYTVALGRASEPEGKAFWIKQVVEEGKTGADCARFFLLDADEFMKRGLSVEDFVETLYATFFDRESDAAGKKGWVDAIKSGKKTRAEVVNDFIESTEWCNVCATYGVKSGAKWHKATFASKNAKDFATRLYTCCLGRDPEEGGLKYWSLALTNLEQTGCSAAKLFFTSDEFVGFKLKDEEYIKRLYTTFMGREPAASEVSYWMGEIKKGTQTKYSVMQFFGQSPEFTGICKKYGIDRGEI